MKRLILFCLLPGLAAAQERARKPQDLASLLPAGTLLLAECDDLGGFERWSRETALGRIWLEPEVQVFVKRLHATLHQALARPAGLVGLQPGDLDGISVRRAGFALIHAGLGAGGPEIDAVLTVQFRSGVDRARKIVRAVREALDTFLGVPFEEVGVRGRKAFRTAVGKTSVHFLTHGDRFWLTTSKARMEQVLDAIDGGNPKSLASSERFVRILKRMGAGRRTAMLYADVPRIYERVVSIVSKTRGEDIRPWADDVWKKSGMGGVDALACADIPSGTGFRSELALTLHGKPRGFFALVQPGHVDHRFARHAPEGCLAYGAETFDLARFWDAMLGWLNEFEPGVRETVDSVLKDYNGVFGVDLRRDLLQSLGDRWGWYLGAPPGGGLVPDCALFVTVKDKERVDRVLRACVEKFGPAMALHGGERAAQRGPRLRLGETHFRGVRIRFAEITARRGEPVLFTPAWAFGEDYLVMGAWPHTVKNALIGKPSLAGKADFRDLQGAIPKSAVSCTYLDTRGLVTWLYNTAVPLLQGVQGAANRMGASLGLEINLHDLPPARVITRHLTGTMFYTAAEPGCLRMGFVSPFGSALLAAPLVAVAAPAALVTRAVHEEARADERAMARIERLLAEIEQQIRDLGRELDR